MHIIFVQHFHQINDQAWNQLNADSYPFTRHQFLDALEQSKSAVAETGWQPQHLLVMENEKLIAALPLYVKLHSYGEYVFDWAWADAYKRNGLEYYPKLLSAIPFTPCTGPRLLCIDQHLSKEIISRVIDAIKQRVEILGGSSWHCLFSGEALSQELAASGISQRIGTQFHWFNRSYDQWDDFVAQLTSRKRKNINKERRHVQEQGIHFNVKEGEDISADDWKMFYQLYCNTYLKRSGHQGYLTEAFFEIIGRTMADALVMIVAQHQQRSIAASLFFKDATTLYGRYWGCLEEYDFLHFETCYYQGIDYAINNKLQRFDGGAQGEHKIQRGFEPIKTYSNHWLQSDDFQLAVNRFLEAETISVNQYIEGAKSYLPFKNAEADSTAKCITV